MEREGHILHSFKVVQMVVVNIKQYRNIGGQLQKGIYKLAGFANHCFGFARNKAFHLSVFGGSRRGGGIGAFAGAQQNKKSRKGYVNAFKYAEARNKA